MEPATTPRSENNRTPQEARDHLVSSPEPLNIRVEDRRDTDLQIQIFSKRLQQSSINSWVKGANSLAVVVSNLVSSDWIHTDGLKTALFAAVQVSLVQIVVSYEDAGNNVTWNTLRWFMYAGVLTDLGGTASAIAIVNMLSSATITARSKAIEVMDSAPRKVMDGLPIDPNLFTDSQEVQLLREFGVSSAFAKD
ncbi:1283_t:CDS:2 [Acaulospora colombiana]|uniref:1283_t:CDS:1 n=1 Tax=Acaulospora colombiana TaxID=27376 RepID=A0ACA9LRS9_9GLOM|nr:1283_t:CDS:2 [Acaulospora colombiana]